MEFRRLATAATLEVEFRHIKMSIASQITSIDTRQGGADQLFRELRDKLSPRGDVVSEAGKQRTIDLFGEALTPQQVVQRICEDVRAKGMDAVLDYTARLDRKELTADTVRVPAEELAEAAKKADPKFIETVRQIRDNVREFQSAVLPNDAVVNVTSTAARWN